MNQLIKKMRKFLIHSLFCVNPAWYSSPMLNTTYYLDNVDNKDYCSCEKKTRKETCKNDARASKKLQII